ncbi:hypothetical protein JB92DRAFT_2832129 [Gautieria morchelliformis]|nr:hypothetical protein JB92DRAFT_2832129 [Gautieria morchelliformis]
MKLQDPDPQHIIIGDAAWATDPNNAGAGAPTKLPTPVMPLPPRDISPLLHSTPEAPVECTESTVAFEIKGTIWLGRGPKLLGEEHVKALDQHVAGWIPVTVCEGNLSVMLAWEHEESEVGLAWLPCWAAMLEQMGMEILPVLYE